MILSIMTYSPPFTLTPFILKKLQDISRNIGVLVGSHATRPSVKLRRSNTIKTIQASLSIEGNTLSLDQVTDILGNKRVLAPLKDILEVKNAIKVYENFKNFDPLKIKDLLKAHGILMHGLIDEAGTFRSSSVGILKGKEVAHVAPQAKRVYPLMEDLFSFLRKNNTPWILKACIFHYELEFIHPFQDVNGRMGRLWQHLLLIKEDPLFFFICVEELIKNRQQEYYDVLSLSDKKGESTPFIEFSLTAIDEALKIFEKSSFSVPNDPLSRLMSAKERLIKPFTRKDYRALYKAISTATASRDLLFW